MHEPTALHLTVIGAGPAYTDRPGASGAAYLVTHGDDSLLLDIGQGAFPRLFGRREPSTLGAIAVSHLHPDHFIDLVPLRHYLRFEFVPPKRARVIGPRELAGRLDALHAAPGFAAESLDVAVLGGETHRIGALVLEAALVRHTDESYAMRVSVEGAATGLVYSGDCGRAEDLLPLLRPGDTLLSEVSFGPGPVPAGAEHLDGPAVGRIAMAAGVGEVLLTHLQMGFDPEATIASVRAAGWGGPVRFVWPGDELDVAVAGHEGTGGAGSAPPVQGPLGTAT